MHDPRLPRGADGREPAGLMMLRALLTLLLLAVLGLALARVPHAQSLHGVTVTAISAASPEAQTPRLVGLPSPDVRKERIRTILARREFVPAHETLTDKVVRWIGRKIGRMFAWLADKIGLAGGSTQWIAVVISIVVVVFFLWLLARVVARLVPRGMGGSGEREEDAHAGPGSPKQALEEAAKLAAAGDFRSAVRLVYLAALLRLDERYLIRFDRTGTNWEYLRAISGHRQFHGALQPVTLTFDRKWYGHEPASESDYGAFVDAYQAVESAEAG